MQDSIFYGLLIIVFSATVGCSSFKQVVPQLKEKDLSEKCEGLIPLVKKNWKKHKTLDYHQYNESFFKKLQTEYRDCILTLTPQEVVKIFGEQPADWGDSHIFYYIREGCIGFPENCELLLFAIHNGKVRTVYINKHEGIIN